MHWLLLAALTLGPTANPRTAAERLVQQGAQQARVSDIEEAEASFREAARVDPTYATAHTRLSALLRRSDRHRDAVLALRSALDTPGLGGDTMVTLLVDLGRTYEDLSHREPAERPEHLRSALQAYERAIAADPSAARTHERRGWALQQLDEPVEADRAYRLCISHDARHAPCFWRLAKLYRSHGFDDEAMAVLEVGRAQVPDDAWLALEHGMLLAAKGRTDEAIRVLRTVAPLIEPGHIDLWFALGTALADVGERDAAIEALQRFQEMAGTDAPAHIRRAAREALERLRNPR